MEPRKLRSVSYPTIIFVTNPPFVGLHKQGSGVPNEIEGGSKSSRKRGSEDGYSSSDTDNSSDTSLSSSQARSRGSSSRSSSRAPFSNSSNKSRSSKSSRSGKRHKKKRKDKDKEFARLQQEFARLQELNGSLEKENAVLRKNPRAMVAKSALAAQVSIPSGKTEDIKDYVKGPEIWRDVKFLSTDEETMDVCAVLIKNMNQFASLRTDDAALAAATLEEFHRVYGGIVRSAINARRTDVTSALKKAYEKRYIEGKPMPTGAQLRRVVLRKGLEPTEAETYEDFMSRTSDLDPETLPPEQKELLEIAEEDWDRREQERAKAHNDAVPLMRDFFKWYWNFLLPAVASKVRWGSNYRKHLTISEGVFKAAGTKKLITDSDEAFVVIVYENCENRFPYTAECKKDGKKVNEKDEKYQTRWCDDGAGLQKFGGWNNKGRKRYVKLVQAIWYTKQKATVKTLEQGILKEIMGEDAKALENIAPETAPKKDDQSFGGAEGKASFLTWDMSKVDLSGVSSDLDDPEDDFQTPKESKKKTAKV